MAASTDRLTEVKEAMTPSPVCLPCVRLRSDRFADDGVVSRITRITFRSPSRWVRCVDPTRSVKRIARNAVATNSSPDTGRWMVPRKPSTAAGSTSIPCLPPCHALSVDGLDRLCGGSFNQTEPSPTAMVEPVRDVVDPVLDSFEVTQVGLRDVHRRRVLRNLMTIHVQRHYTCPRVSGTSAPVPAYQHTRVMNGDRLLVSRSTFRHGEQAGHRELAAPGKATRPPPRREPCHRPPLCRWVIYPGPASDLRHDLDKRHRRVPHLPKWDTDRCGGACPLTAVTDTRYTQVFPPPMRVVCQRPSSMSR